MSSPTHADLIRALAATPDWMSDLVPRTYGQHVANGESTAWTGPQIVMHLRASDAISAPRIIQVLLRPGLLLVGLDERIWASQIALAHVPVDDQIAAFRVSRRELVAILASLLDDQWLEFGTHEELGRVTIVDLARAIVEHEADHKQQLEALT